MTNKDFLEKELERLTAQQERLVAKQKEAEDFLSALYKELDFLSSGIVAIGQAIADEDKRIAYAEKAAEEAKAEIVEEPIQTVEPEEEIAVEEEPVAEEPIAEEQPVDEKEVSEEIAQPFQDEVDEVVDEVEETVDEKVEEVIEPIEEEKAEEPIEEPAIAEEVSPVVEAVEEKPIPQATVIGVGVAPQPPRPINIGI